MTVNNNKRGVALILSFVLILLLASLGGYLFVKSGYENELTRQSTDSTKAFWAAEAGIAKKVAQLPNTAAIVNEALDGNSNLTYNVPQPTLVPGYLSRWTVSSTGTCASKRGTRDISMKRKVEVVVAGANSGGLENTVETTGTLDIGNNVTINGSTEENSTLTFEQVFGLTEAQVKAQADRVYTNPATNQQPVSGITWVDLTGSNKYSISSTWSGSGLLIVHHADPTKVALDISGQWTFTGVVWVIGKLSISGTGCHITGAAFAESGSEINKFTGSSELSFSSTYRDSAFGLLGTDIISWKEVNP
jgi:Tfp pilus assembly protein PilX